VTTPQFTRRDAVIGDLPRIVAIYNSTIPTRIATADLEPVSVESRIEWFSEHEPGRRPLWVVEIDGDVRAWLSLSSFYGRPAYGATVEVSVYVDERNRAQGLGTFLVGEALAQAPALGIRTLLAFVFGHNVGSVALFSRYEFEPWGWLPGVAVLDGLPRDLAILGRHLDASSEVSRR
jgi:L-amino acid N-acyltransferase YncA